MMNQLDGLLLVDKPGGMTSHDVVYKVRKRFKQKKVGHCGTLDPMATGLLMLVLGKATKMQDLLMSEDKEYSGTLKLGETTDSQDADGEITSSSPVPDLKEDDLMPVFDKYTGDFYQTPPMVSAVKKDGVPLYKLARKGVTVQREPRVVQVFNYEILDFSLPVVEFHIKCSKGFYVRTYAHEIGQELGCGAHLIQLRRTRSGNFNVSDALTLEDLSSNDAEEILQSRVLSLAEISQIRRS